MVAAVSVITALVTIYQLRVDAYQPIYYKIGSSRCGSAALFETKPESSKPSGAPRKSSYSLFNLKNDGEKKDLKRLMLNILFPNIYQDYEDTREIRKTIVIDTRKGLKVKSRNEDIKSFQSQESKSGSYAAFDPSLIPKEVNTAALKSVPLKPISRPADFVASSQPKEGKLPVFGGVSVLSDIKSYGPRPVKPIILYDYEGSGDCRRVREACSMLDINIDFRPCPGATAGFSDQQATITIGGKRSVPFMIDNNPGMIK
jgi:hypothetical protein